jgi:hypothetical protein
LKYKVQRGLSGATLRASVPARYRSRLPDELPEPSYTLLLFRNDHNDVVLSRAVKSALDHVASEAAPLLAVGGCFTAEGLALLRGRQATVLQLSDFHWTDDSYQAIRQRP